MSFDRPTWYDLFTNFTFFWWPLLCIDCIIWFISSKFSFKDFMFLYYMSSQWTSLFKFLLTIFTIQPFFSVWIKMLLIWLLFQLLIACFTFYSFSARYWLVSLCIFMNVTNSDFMDLNYMSFERPTLDKWWNLSEFQKLIKKWNINFRDFPFIISSIYLLRT